MTTLAIIVALIIIIALIYLATLDGNYEVRRSLNIASDQKTVFDKVRDFRTWPEWNPWLLHEPDATLAYSPTPDQQAGWYSWDGKIIGAGKLTHTAFSGSEKIEQRIEFTRPFKSTNQVWWEFESMDDGSTTVHWNMAGNMPFLFRFMAKKIPSFISKDYDTGLYLLRAELEQDPEVPRISFDGVVEIADQSALTIHFEGNLEAMKNAMQDGFPKLGRYVDEHKLEVTGYPFTIYHSANTEKSHFICDMAIPVSATTTSEDFVIKSFDGGRYFKTTLKGSYEFLELAWYQAYAHLQMQKIKPRSGGAPLEMYQNDPAQVSHSNEIETAIYIPLK